MTELSPIHRFAWTTKAAGTTMTGVHELEPTATGTRNTLRVEIDGGSAWFVGRALAPAFRRAITQENLGFKAAAEKA